LIPQHESIHESESEITEYNFKTTICLEHGILFPVTKIYVEFHGTCVLFEVQGLKSPFHSCNVFTNGLQPCFFDCCCVCIGQYILDSEDFHALRVFFGETWEKLPSLTGLQ